MILFVRVRWYIKYRFLKLFDIVEFIEYFIRVVFYVDGFFIVIVFDFVRKCLIK